MIKQTVYVPVNLKDNGCPDDGYYFIFAKNNHTGTIETACECYDGDFYLNEDKGYPSDSDKIESYLLQKENAYIFTEQELLELKRKWAEEAFDAGMQCRGSNTKLVSNDWGGRGVNVNVCGMDTQKEQYINNLKLD